MPIESILISDKSEMLVVLLSNGKWAQVGVFRKIDKKTLKSVFFGL